MDQAARLRRQRKALEALEADNFQDDPHADLKMSKKAPRFDDGLELKETGMIEMNLFWYLDNYNEKLAY